MGKSSLISSIKSYLSGNVEGGIELATDGIKLVKYGSGCTVIEKMERVILTPEVYAKGEIIDEESFILQLAPVVKSMGLTLRDIALVIPDNVFSISTIELFKTENAEEKMELLRSELEEKVYNFDASLYDIQYINSIDLNGNKEEVIAFALSLEHKERYIAILERLKLFPVIMTPTVYPLTLALLQQKTLLGVPLYKAGVMVNFGGGNNKILIESGRECKYYRTVTQGSNQGNEIIQEYLSVNAEVSEVIKREFDLMVDLPPTNPYYAVFTDYKHLIQDHIEQLESILRIYEKNNPKEFVEWIIITGGVANQKGLIEYIQNLPSRRGINERYKIVKADYSSKFSSKLKNHEDLMLYDSLVGLLKD